MRRRNVPNFFPRYMVSKFYYCNFNKIINDFYCSAQRDGLLSETFHEETIQADPFYANCRLHTEKSTIK